MSKGFKLKKLTVTMVFSVLFFFVGLRMNDVEAAIYSGTANGKSLSTIKTQTDATSYCSCGKSIGTTGHWCCWNYASNAYAKIWGTSFARSDNNNLLKNVAAADRKFTAANLKKYLAFAQPGANLRIDSSSTATASDSNGHSLIFCGMDSAGDGAYFLEGNYDGKGHTRLADVKFSSLVNTYSSYGYTYIKYIMWPGGSSVNMSAPSISNIKTTNSSNGTVKLECDVTAANGVKAVNLTIWPTSLGIDSYKWVTQYTVSGNHYTFTFVPEQLFDGIVGEYKINVHAWDKNDVKSTLSTAYVFNISKHTTHTWAKVSAKAATCTVAGTIEHNKCTLCGVLDVSSTYVAPLGHNYVKSETKATCTTTGSSIEKCSRCSATRNSTTTPALGHNYVKSETKATCTTAGSSIEKCSRCSATRNSTTTPALGHDYVKSETKATCTTEGSSIEKCSRCSGTRNATTVPALGHNMGSYVSNNDATTTSDGTKTRTCTRCTYKETVTDVGSKLPDEKPNGWYHTTDVWIYFVEGNLVSGWKKLDGYWYYFDSNCEMVTDWKKINNVWYYFNPCTDYVSHIAKEGAMVTGWKKLNNVWYYFDANGAMQTGWKLISDKWYYFNANGAMQTGWQMISNKWYYFETSGVMVTGWKQISGKWYYFESSGAMAADKWINGTYYMKSNGVMATNEWIGKYYVDANGKWVQGKTK